MYDDGKHRGEGEAQIPGLPLLRRPTRSPKTLSALAGQTFHVCREDQEQTHGAISEQQTAPPALPKRQESLRLTNMSTTLRTKLTLLRRETQAHNNRPLMQELTTVGPAGRVVVDNVPWQKRSPGRKSYRGHVMLQLPPGMLAAVHLLRVIESCKTHTLLPRWRKSPRRRNRCGII